jgi:hypothetical protein
MRDGEAFIKFSYYDDNRASGIPGMGGLDFTMPGGFEEVNEEIKWKEQAPLRTDQTLQKDDKSDQKIKGKRCILCGYIEFFAT